MLTVEECIRNQYEKMQKKESKVEKKEDNKFAFKEYFWIKKGEVYEISMNDISVIEWIEFIKEIEKNTDKYLYEFDFDNNKVYLYMALKKKEE